MLIEISFETLQYKLQTELLYPVDRGTSTQTHFSHKEWYETECGQYMVFSYIEDENAAVALASTIRDSNVYFSKNTSTGIHYCLLSKHYFLSWFHRANQRLTGAYYYPHTIKLTENKKLNLIEVIKFDDIKSNLPKQILLPLEQSANFDKKKLNDLHRNWYLTLDKQLFAVTLTINDRPQLFLDWLKLHLPEGSFIKLTYNEHYGIYLFLLTVEQFGIFRQASCLPLRYSDDEGSLPEKNKKMIEVELQQIKKIFTNRFIYLINSKKQITPINQWHQTTDGKFFASAVKITPNLKSFQQLIHMTNTEFKQIFVCYNPENKIYIYLVSALDFMKSTLIHELRGDLIYFYQRIKHSETALLKPTLNHIILDNHLISYYEFKDFNALIAGEVTSYINSHLNNLIATKTWLCIKIGTLTYYAMLTKPYDLNQELSTVATAFDQANQFPNLRLASLAGTYTRVILLDEELFMKVYSYLLPRAATDTTSFLNVEVEDHPLTREELEMLEVEASENANEDEFADILANYDVSQPDQAETDPQNPLYKRLFQEESNSDGFLNAKRKYDVAFSNTQSLIDEAMKLIDIDNIPPDETPALTEEEKENAQALLEVWQENRHNAMGYGTMFTSPPQTVRTPQSELEEEDELSTFNFNL